MIVSKLWVYSRVTYWRVDISTVYYYFSLYCYVLHLKPPEYFPHCARFRNCNSMPLIIYNVRANSTIYCLRHWRTRAQLRSYQFPAGGLCTAHALIAPWKRAGAGEMSASRICKVCSSKFSDLSKLRRHFDSRCHKLRRLSLKMRISEVLGICY